VCNGATGNEIDFIYTTDFVDKKFYEPKIFELVDADGEILKTMWLQKDELINGKFLFVPE